MSVNSKFCIGSDIHYLPNIVGGRGGAPAFRPPLAKKSTNCDRNSNCIKQIANKMMTFCCQSFFKLVFSYRVFILLHKIFSFLFDWSTLLILQYNCVMKRFKWSTMAQYNQKLLCILFVNNSVGVAGKKKETQKILCEWTNMWWVEILESRFMLLLTQHMHSVQVN